MVADCRTTLSDLFRSFLIGGWGWVGGCLVAGGLMRARGVETVVKFIECKEISISGWLAQAVKVGLRRYWLVNGNG
jgi:hypothetical protein